MLSTKLTPDRGLIRVSGTVPNGSLVVQRKSEQQKAFTLRGGLLNITTQGFSLEDSEAPIGIPLTYTATSTPTDRLIQRNLVRTPDFDHGVQSWTAGASRTVSGAGVVSANPAGTGAGVPGRTIAEVATAPLTPSSTYLITGKLKFTTPGVWTWQDVKEFGTWSAVRAAKANWEAVRSTAATGAGSSTYGTVFVSLSNGATDYVAPTQAFNIHLDEVNSWMTFAVYVTTPSVIPSTARLRILHGTGVREYAITWTLDEFSMMTAADSAKPFRLFWFSGDTPVPARPQDYITQNSEWEDVSGDATIIWEGVVGNSVSRFTGPSVISTSVTAQISTPAIHPCEPVLLSDPVSTALAQWFGLAAVGTLTREARQTVLSVLGRSDFVSTSSARGSAKGTLTLYTDTLEERRNAVKLFESGRILLLRNPDPSYPESNWYIAIGNVTESRTIDMNAREPGRTWVVPFVQVERPTGLIEASSGVTWQMVKDSGMTWAQLRAAHESWLDVVLSEPSI